MNITAITPIDPATALVYDIPNHFARPIASFGVGAAAFGEFITERFNATTAALPVLAADLKRAKASGDAEFLDDVIDSTRTILALHNVLAPLVR